MISPVKIIIPVRVMIRSESRKTNIAEEMN